MKIILDKLFELADKPYGDFTARLMPTVSRDKVIGVRTPELRQMATWVIKNGLSGEFLRELPHEYYEENNLHAFIIEKIKDYDKCINEVNAFLPQVDNWATCDQMSPKCFKGKKELINNIMEWISSEHVYTVRFGIGMIMRHFLDENFDPRYLEIVSAIKSDEYYINMMIAWFFATALTKQYDKAIEYIRDKKLDKDTHNKAIRKAIESYRIPPETKEYLKTLKIM